MLCDPQRHLILHCKKKSRNDIDNPDTKYVKDTRGSAGRYGYSKWQRKIIHGSRYARLEQETQEWNKTKEDKKNDRKFRKLSRG